MYSAVLEINDWMNTKVQHRKRFDSYKVLGRFYELFCSFVAPSSKFYELCVKCSTICKFSREDGTFWT
jgi:hypothetical protein